MRYAGVEDHYFVAVALLNDAPARADYSPVTLPVPGAAQNITRSFMSFSVRPNPGAAPSQTAAVPFYFGPKDFDKLHAADPQLVRAIDFGMFAIIVVPLLQALKWINHYLGNYGWSIVVLTVLINILIFPLRHRSMVSMKKMQAIQPRSESDPGSVREIQGHRPRAPEDEHGNDGALQAKGRDPGRAAACRCC